MSVESSSQSNRIPIWPWLSKGVSMAFDPRKLLLGAIGIGLMGLGWFAIDSMFAGNAFAESVFPKTGLGGPGSPYRATESVSTVPSRITMPVRVLGAPWLRVFSEDASWTEFAHAGLAGVWGVMVWGIIGGAIARIAVVEAGTTDRASFLTALKFAFKRSYALIGSPLAPLLIVGFLAVPGILVGAISRLGELGETISGVLGFLPILAAVPLTILLLALAITWPLMHLTVVAEGEDIFDAISRSFSYISQRTGRYAVLVGVASLLGMVGELLLLLVAYLVMNLAAWTVSLSAPHDRVAIALGANGPILALWTKIIDIVVLSWSYSYLWSASALIYLILRREVDGVPTHDVYFPSHEADTFAPVVSTPE